jgi:hypothetical protein
MKFFTLNFLTGTIAVAALLLSAWNIWFANLRGLKLFIVPDDEIRLRQFPGQTGWSLLFIVTASGPESKWATVKFTQTNFIAPDEHVYALQAMSHLIDVGIGQKNASRNIPIAIKGGDSKSITIGYQCSEMPVWQRGKYRLRLAAVDGHGREIFIKPVRFVLEDPHFTNVINPQNDVMTRITPDEATP